MDIRQTHQVSFISIFTVFATAVAMAVWTAVGMAVGTAAATAAETAAPRPTAGRGITGIRGKSREMIQKTS